MCAQHHRRRWFGDLRLMSADDADHSVGTARTRTARKVPPCSQPPFPTNGPRGIPRGPASPTSARNSTTRFAQTVSAVAALLADAGLRRGGVLAVMLPNRVELITGMFAAWRLGAAVTPVNPALTGQEARYQIDDAGANVVIADGASAAKLAGGGYRSWRGTGCRNARSSARPTRCTTCARRAASAWRCPASRWAWSTRRASCCPPAGG
jgi:non-ribosomal peptide synthetase component F